MYSLANTSTGAFKNARAIGAPINFLMNNCLVPLMNGLTQMREVRVDDDLRKPVSAATCGDYSAGHR